MKNQWLELAYSHISPKARDEIFKKIAKMSLMDWIDDYAYIWKDGGWPEIGSVIERFIEKNKFYEQIASPTGNERYFQIAQKVGLDELYFVNLKDGGK